MNSMEKELNSSPALFPMEISSDQVRNCFFHSTFDDPTDPFESALSSLVSSPTAASTAGEGTMIRELIGRLGTICDSGEISPQSCIATANNTPLNSPPKFNLSPLSVLNHTSQNFPNHPPSLPFFNRDPGFAERAAKFSSFGRGEFGIGNRSVTNLQNGKLSRVSSNPSIRGGNSQFDRSSGAGERNKNGEMGDSREGSSVSEQNPGGEIGGKSQNDASSRKRKSIPKPKVNDDKGEAEKENDEGSNAKRSKTDEEGAEKKNAGESNANNSKDKQSNSNGNTSKETAKPEPAKDYIHVRARRGQATDSHSLAERVRREKISERMKFLQDLVPGCNKVTGKATVLDEIINYVQSLQRQVEFLSMKLATVNPRMEFNVEALLSKDMFQCRGTSLPQTMYPLDHNSSAHGLPFWYQSAQQLPPTLFNGIPSGTENPFSVNPLNPTGILRNPILQSPSIGGLSDPMTQIPTLWEDDLQSLVQMSLTQNQTQIGPDTLSNSQMKVEL